LDEILARIEKKLEKDQYMSDNSNDFFSSKSQNPTRKNSKLKEAPGESKRQRIYSSTKEEEAPLQSIFSTKNYEPYKNDLWARNDSSIRLGEHSTNLSLNTKEKN